MVSRARVVVLSRNDAKYKGAFYQGDFLKEMSRQAECWFYGPGFQGYDPALSLASALEHCPFTPDFLLTSHSFLQDNPSHQIERMPQLKLDDSPVPVFGLLNKEYSRLEQKIDFFSSSGVEALFTHHHDLDSLLPGVKIRHFFAPFAVDQDRFPYSEGERRYDLGFSGLVRNPIFPDTQSGIRDDLQTEIFTTFQGVPLWKRSQYRDVTVSWHSWRGLRVLDSLSGIFGHSRLSTRKYIALLSATKLWLNTPSPLGLISTRYFECMASGSLVMAQASEELLRFFPPGLVATFDGVEDFPRALRELLSDQSEISKRTKQAYDWVRERHTWKVRVSEVLHNISDLIR